jgi:uncharacterized protein YukE
MQRAANAQSKDLIRRLGEALAGWELRAEEAATTEQASRQAHECEKQRSVQEIQQAQEAIRDLAEQLRNTEEEVRMRAEQVRCPHYSFRVLFVHTILTGLRFGGGPESRVTESGR